MSPPPGNLGPSTELLIRGHRASAEDIVQDAFLGLYRRWERLTDTSTPLAYLRVSVLNGCRTALRRRSRARSVGNLTERRLPPVTEDPRAVGRRARGARGTSRLRGWLVPAAAAAAVLAIALSLVLIRDNPSRRVTPPTRPAPTVDGVPAYYAGLAKASGAQTSPEQIVVGQTVTGKRLATVAPPAGTTFAGITGAADDRTFVVDTQPGSLDAESEPWQPRTWYLLRIDPGSAKAAQLTPLPIPGTAQGTNVAAIALSPDGTELAVALQPDGLNDQSALTYLRVYSVATGALLHSWFATAASDPSGQPQLFAGPKYAGPDSNLALAWVGQRGLAFGYTRAIPAKTVDGSDVSPQTVTLAQIRYISLQTKNGGDVIDAGKALADLTPGPRAAPAPLACGPGALDAILVTEPGPTLICGATGGSYSRGGDAKTRCPPEPGFGLGLVEYAAGASAPSRVLATYTARCAGPLVVLQPLWSNPAGTTQLGLLGLGADGGTAAVRFGIFSKGKFTALPMPVTAGGSAIDPGPLNYIAW
jgi:Sigma-70 region 2